LVQVAVPLACTLFFIRRGETTAVAATMFWTFENLRAVGFYMADARRSEFLWLAATRRLDDSSRTGACCSTT
jgi:hypothetical protein